MEEITSTEGDEKMIEKIEGKFSQQKAQARDVMSSEMAQILYVHVLQTSTYVGWTYQRLPHCFRMFKISQFQVNKFVNNN
jgi:hypothetical protein